MTPEMKSSRLDQRSGGWVLLLPPSTLYVTKPNHPIIFLPNPPPTGPWHYKPHLGSLYSKGSRIYGQGPLHHSGEGPKIQLYSTLPCGPLSPLVSGGHEIVARMWQFPQLSCPSLPTRAGLMNMVIMGNHSINGARSNFLWFSPRYPPPLLPIRFNLTLASKWISESSQIISQPRKNSCLWRRALWWQVSPPC